MHGAQNTSHLKLPHSQFRFFLAPFSSTQNGYKNPQKICLEASGSKQTDKILSRIIKQAPPRFNNTLSHPLASPHGKNSENAVLHTGN